ncbi:MAG: glutamine-hydrolyzing GMP synthase [Spirochaetales bacterium]|nr:glutamine-hydrolyzing GMP synthase [Spirochaetales bacterium]
MKNDTIVVLDFGSQYAHLIAKRLRLMGFYSEIALPSSDLSVFDGAKGIIFSGGPSSVYADTVPEFNKEILSLTIPLLGLCYGHQLLALESGGKVGKAAVGEFGIASLEKTDTGESELFTGIPFPTQVWMSHQDAVLSPPPGYRVIATTKDCPYAGLENLAQKRWSLQCHVEVKDTPQGDTILANFASICGMEKNWSGERVLETIMADIQSQANRDGKKRKVLLFLSGGVDSTVAFALLNKALGQERVLGLHIDNGFMRKNESAIIARRYREAGFTNFIVEDASETFLAAVQGLSDPQLKRKAVGETFITVRNQVVSRLGLNEEDWLLGQGTLYPDIIESGGTKNSHTIKTHHNRVDGIQALIEKGLIIEPLRDLYKDEVRTLGKRVGLSDELVFRHPFPGPGLSINVLCRAPDLDDREELERARESIKAIDIDGELTNLGATVDALPVRSVGVQGDFRTYRFPAVLSFKDIFSYFPSWDLLEKESSRITNASDEVNRTVLELAKKAGTFSIREAWCDKARLDQTREVDAITLEAFKSAGWYTKIFQHLTINIPWSTTEGHCSIVLRPVVSEDVMTARFAHLDRELLKSIVEKIMNLGYIDAVYYDITNKPPATFGWE